MLHNTTVDSQHNDASFPGIWEELNWRGLIKASTDKTELRNLLNGGSIAYYCGFDPTAPSLHVGNLVQLLFMRRLQLAGHKPLALVGGSTGLIGDPRPTAERVLNDKQTVDDWVEKLQEQVSSFFSARGTNSLRLVNNLDWFGHVTAIDFLRDLGKFFRVGPMLRKEAVRKRLDSDEGISFTEFSYQILQASDFLELFRNENCLLQTGGSDQWGNLTGGVELVHKAEGETVHAIGTPLIENSDGTKFGKSEGNAIWLDPNMTSPFSFFQFWMNTADDDVIDRLKVFTFLSKEEIDNLNEQVLAEPGKREAQKVLAFEVTSIVHGVEVAKQIQEASLIVFNGGDVKTLSEDSVNQVLAELGVNKVNSESTLGEAFVKTGLCSSLSDARRTAKQNGLSFNGSKVSNVDKAFSESELLFGRVGFLRKGKKQIAGVEVN